MTTQLLKELPPHFAHEYSPPDSSERVYITVYEEYEKQLNSSKTLTCIIEYTPTHNKFILKKTGGRTGFRGSLADSEPNIEGEVVGFIHDFTKRHGLTLQEVQPPKPTGES